MTSEAFNIGQLQSSRSLTNDLVESLRSKILGGNMAAGTKLPPAKDIEEQAGVSRSVVREAVAALKAEGLIISRQGVGMFVANKSQIQRFEIDSKEFSSIEDAVKILELRMAVELEMTSMAAKNRTNEQMAHIWDCLAKFDKKLAQGDDAVKEDLAIHLAIANASGNPYFARFIKFIGEGVIPAREIITDNETSVDSIEYLKLIQAEHKKIAEAIEAQEPEVARYATLEHLGNSRKRHLKIISNMKNQ
ncbi:FadR/GntR family transcriptional regulator [Colwellia sp. Bg11-28]|uniref:FadR/GntR family transcriptional regulator n=1 Tax=Colwellia sp. Bg11-28 TaxID=2058305 RepID=UPI000C348C83|nr:FadR/GntR family transcriptional regulator [Colwellia sp. Bg11-28]PKH88549.1 GntR family transcriptional regulator [Colwellia sp. Bg11-28]